MRTFVVLRRFGLYGGDQVGTLLNMPSNESSLRQGQSPSGASVAAFDSASFSCRSGPLPSTLDHHGRNTLHL